MLDSGKKFPALRYKKNKYSNSYVVRKLNGRFLRTFNCVDAFSIILLI